MSSGTIEQSYSIFKTGGKQYQAVVGKTLTIEKIVGEPGDTVSFDTVLFVKRDEGKYELGKPNVSGAKVVAKIVRQAKGPKLTVFKFKKRKKYRLKKGHRQPMTLIQFEKAF